MADLGNSFVNTTVERTFTLCIRFQYFSIRQFICEYYSSKKVNFMYSFSIRQFICEY